MNHHRHISDAGDLITPRPEVRAGFLAMALEKSRRAGCYVEQGRALRAAAMQADKASDLLALRNIQPALLAAAGLSDKALSHLEEADKQEAIGRLVEEFLEPAGEDFVDELVYRFLLIKGDSFGGSMRNLAGFLAERFFKRSVISALRIRNLEFYWQSKRRKRWFGQDLLDGDVDDVNGIAWNLNGDRTLLFNKTVKLISKNIDICLLRSSYRDSKRALRKPAKYVVLGELKGGIDPAGADEHWKTARTALQRIIDGFSEVNQPVETLFIGAAIEKAMADEIWGWLESGKLSNTGNLTNRDHIAAVCCWLVEA